ncbi:reverse transcriptase domain-containing protein [Tanacetum coccineum]
MAERTMEELLRAPTEGITSTLRFRNVPNDVIKLMMFPYSLEGAAKTWYEKEPPNSILTWEDLVTKFVNQFFPPSKTTHLKNKISRFTQKFDESFSEAWERLMEMLRACPHHRFTELTQVDTFYNGLNDNDQDSLNAAAGGNLLSKTTREALNIIENKSKVRYSRNKPNASRMNTTSRESVSKTDERIDKLTDQLSTLVEIVSTKVVTLAPVKAVEETCVTCGGAHSWYNCPTTDNNQASVYAATGPAGIVQTAKLRKLVDTREGGEESVMSTQEYIRKVIEDVGEDDDFTRAPWLSAIDYVNVDGGIMTGCFGDVKKFLKNGKLEKVVAVIKSCTPNSLGDLTVTLKDLSGTISSTIHYKVFIEDRFAKVITVGAALILHNVSVFSPKQSTHHYLNIIKKNMVKVFHKDGGSA